MHVGFSRVTARRLGFPCMNNCNEGEILQDVSVRGQTRRFERALGEVGPDMSTKTPILLEKRHYVRGQL